MWKHYILDPLCGRTPLWRVVWLQGFGASLLYALLGSAFVPATHAASAAYLIGGLLIGIVQSVMLWQCAYNSRSRATGHLVRTAVVIGAVLMPLALYLWWRHPELGELAL